LGKGYRIFLKMISVSNKISRYFESGHKNLSNQAHY
jgi:hypothetical protein